LDWIQINFKAYISPPSTGTYRFRVEANDKAILHMGKFSKNFKYIKKYMIID